MSKARLVCNNRTLFRQLARSVPLFSPKSFYPNRVCQPMPKPLPPSVSAPAHFDPSLVSLTHVAPLTWYLYKLGAWPLNTADYNVMASPETNRIVYAFNDPPQPIDIAYNRINEPPPKNHPWTHGLPRTLGTMLYLEHMFHENRQATPYHLLDVVCGLWERADLYPHRVNYSILRACDRAHTRKAPPATQYFDPIKLTNTLDLVCPYNP